MLDKYTTVSISACVYALVVSPLFLYFVTPPGTILETDWASRIFWPALMLISIVLVIRSPARRSLAWPPHILCLFACLALAGASIVWAFKPESSFVRFLQQVMIVTCIVVPPLFADRRVDLVRALFFCFAFACVLNIFFVVNGAPEMARYGEKLVNIGYPGYFLGKNYLGECATLALLLSVHEMLYAGRRRIMGIIVSAAALFLVFAADSKTALGLAILTPCLAGLTLFAANKMRLSPAIVLLSIPLCYAFLSSVSNFNMNRLSYIVFGDSTLTGRTLIWDFANSEIARRPLLGWGYQSFWLVGSDAPSITDAPGWIKMMPNAHNGYYDTTLEMGYVGYFLLIIFLLATLHAIGRVAQRDTSRAWLLLAIALYVICFNYLESLWMRGFEFLWVVFLVVVAEAGRYWQPLPQRATRVRSGFVAPQHLRLKARAAMRRNSRPDGPKTT